MLNIETGRRYLTYATPQFDGLLPSIEDAIRGFRETVAGLPAGHPDRAKVREEFVSLIESWMRDERDRMEYGEPQRPSAYSDATCD